MIDDTTPDPSNEGSVLAKLMAFTKRLNEEEKRGLAEQLTEEELVVFDLLTKPDMMLTKAEEAEVKKAAKALLAKLKAEKLVLDWRRQQTTRMMVFTTIQDILDQNLPRAYSKEVYDQKCSVIFEHFFEAYSGARQSVYAER